MTASDVQEDERLVAAVRMLRRVGSKSYEIRYSEPDDQHEGSPIVWLAIAEFPGSVPHQVAGALTPYRATFKLLEQLIDGGKCAHCQHPTGISDDLEQLPLNAFICWYVYDPELKTFRRGCEGSNR